MSEKGDRPFIWHQIDPTEVAEKLQSSDKDLFPKRPVDASNTKVPTN
jgi:hypothetical protein